VNSSASVGPALSRGVSIVIPVYRGAATLPELHQRVDAVLTELAVPWELILVDDGSPDQSWSVIRTLADGHADVVGIRLFRNSGQHNALLAGIRAARFDVTVTMDDDLQHRPEAIPVLLEKLTDDVDLVYGRPPVEEHNWWRNATSSLAKLAISASAGSRVARDVSAFRAFRTQMRDAFARVDDPFVSVDVLLSWATTHHTVASTPMDERRVGQSNYTVRKLIRHSVNMLTGYSTAPLRLVAWLGFALSFIGAVIMVWAVTRRLAGADAVPGFAFLASLVSLLAGAQLFALGVIGEYLGRMHFRSMQRPQYTVRDVVGSNPSATGGH
jgi:glycosyltransferase involved in cell wall biosynthesis